MPIPANSESTAMGSSPEMTMPIMMIAAIVTWVNAALCGAPYFGCTSPSAFGSNPELLSLIQI